MKTGNVRLIFAAFALFLALGIAAAPSVIRAQYATATPAMQMSGEGHPAHIHAGTCDNLGGIDYPLNNLVAPNKMGTPGAGWEGSPEAGWEGTPGAGMGSTHKNG